MLCEGNTMHDMNLEKNVVKFKLLIKQTPSQRVSAQNRRML